MKVENGKLKVNVSPKPTNIICFAKAKHRNFTFLIFVKKCLTNSGNSCIITSG